MGSMHDIKTAIAAAPTEVTVEAALRVADGYRSQVEQLQQHIANLTASNLALRLAGAPNAAKAELIDHVISADDSSLVLCEASYRAGRWSFSPLSSLDDARRVMDADLARADEEAREPGDCHCGGAPMCNVCGGQG